MLDVRTIDDAEIPAFREAALTTFGADTEEDPTGTARHRAQIAVPGGGSIADRVRGASAALMAADALFAWPISPWCPEQF